MKTTVKISDSTILKITLPERLHNLSDLNTDRKIVVLLEILPMLGHPDFSKTVSP